MPTRDIIVIGASAGGVSALRRLCAGFPEDLAAAVFIVQHISPTARSVLPQLLDRAGPLPASTPTDGQAFAHGQIYVAAPDHHMLLRPDRILMRRGPHENRTRPAINPLFRSAALTFGSRVVGVVLTGLLDDGTEGLIAIKAADGTSMVQDPDDADWPAMPRNAMARDHVDYVVPLERMATLLAEIARQPAGPSSPLPPEYAAEDRIAAQEFAVMERDIETPGTASPFACPDCGGVLNQIDRGSEERFRCQVGHAFTPLGLAEAQNAELERALAVAVRTHRDRIRLFRRMEAKAEARGLTRAVASWKQACAEAEQMIAALEQTMATFARLPEGDIG